MHSKLVNFLKKFASPKFRNFSTSQNGGTVSHKTSNDVKTAGIIVIGDELLRGYVSDCNAQFIAVEFHKIGVDVKKITIIGDELDGISQEVREFSNLYDYVVTSGGMGPTHDDTAFAAVAKAFNEPLVLNADLEALCQQYYKTSDPQHPGMKLARIPQSAKLTYLSVSNVPQISCRNVYIFPGIPDLLQKWFRNCAQMFPVNGAFFTRRILVNLPEHDIAIILQRFHEESIGVRIGSYPETSDQRFKVKVVIESRDEQLADSIHKRMIQALPADALVDVNNC